MNRLRRFRANPAFKVAALAVCMATAGIAPALAQDAPPPPPPQDQTSAPPQTQDQTPPPPPGQGRGGPGGPAMQARMLEQMTQQLNLTPDQVTKIKAIQAENRDKMMALRNDSSTSPDDRRARSMALRQEEQAKVKKVLTDDQLVKYDQMMKNMRGRGPGGDPGGPPPPPPPTPPSLQ